MLTPSLFKHSITKYIHYTYIRTQYIYTAIKITLLSFDLDIGFKLKFDPPLHLEIEAIYKRFCNNS